MCYRPDSGLRAGVTTVAVKLDREKCARARGGLGLGGLGLRLVYVCVFVGAWVVETGSGQVCMYVHL